MNYRCDDCGFQPFDPRDLVSCQARGPMLSELFPRWHEVLICEACLEQRKAQQKAIDDAAQAAADLRWESGETQKKWGGH